MNELEELDIFDSCLVKLRTFEDHRGLYNKLVSKEILKYFDFEVEEINLNSENFNDKIEVESLDKGKILDLVKLENLNNFLKNIYFPGIFFENKNEEFIKFDFNTTITSKNLTIILSFMKNNENIYVSELFRKMESKF